MGGFSETFINRYLRTVDIGSVTPEGQVSNNDDCNRSEYARLYQSVGAHRKYRRYLPGRCGSGSRCDSHNVHPRNCRTGVRHFRGDHRYDRGHDEGSVPLIWNKTTFCGLTSPLLIIGFLLLIASASATTYISFSPLGLTEETIIINNGSGVLVGVYNTSTKGIALDDDESYTIIVQPSESDLLDNHPNEWLDIFLAKLKANAIPILVMIFCFAMAAIALRRRW